MPRPATPKPPEVEPETYEVGEWAGRTNYGCPFCTFRTLDGTGDVVAHIALLHRDQATAPAEPATETKES